MRKHPIYAGSASRFQAVQGFWVIAGCMMVYLMLVPNLAAQSAREASQLMEQGRYEEAMEAFQSLSSQNPKDQRYAYNAGVAAYRAGLFEEAQDFFDVASLSQDLNLQQQSFYNRGNSLFKEGESQQDFK
ncbi:MAG: tetratricopeptide repeat protein, partial [Limisphaerales bacterium]